MKSQLQVCAKITSQCIVHYPCDVRQDSTMNIRLPSKHSVDQLMYLGYMLCMMPICDNHIPLQEHSVDQLVYLGVTMC
jgi:hypothetical protein